MRHLCVSTLLAVWALPAFATQSPSINYTVSVLEPQTHLFHVELDIEGWTEPEIEVSMPVWSTGYYHVHDYAGQVVELEAFDGSDKRLAGKKIDKNTWRLETRDTDRLTVRYVVYGRQPSITRSFVNARTGHILGSNLFLFLDGHLDQPAALELELPLDWKVSNGAFPDKDNPFRFEFASYHELIDTPMLIGRHDEYSFDIDGVPHVVAIEGDSDMSHEEFVEGATKLARAAHGLFSGLPYEKYCFILFLAPRMGGGLEHSNGTTMGSRPWGFVQDPNRMVRLLDLTSHEYFHTWNVKRLQPKLFKPYDYDTESETGFLWFSEGVTEYYTDHLLLRAGLYTPKTVLDNLAELVGETRNIPGRLYKSAYDASFDTWIASRDENSVNAYFSYYPKGEFAGLILDLEIIKRTNAEKSFDDVLLDMWQAYRDTDAGFDTEMVRELCEEIAGGSFKELFDDYVYGVKEVPFEEYLQMAGYELISDVEKTKEKQKGAYLGARYTERESAVRVTHVLRDTAAWRDGLNFEDEILAVNGIRIESVKELDLQLELLQAGDEATFLVGRRGRVEELQITMEEHPVPIYKIVETDQPTDLQLRIRKKLFRQ